MRKKTQELQYSEIRGQWNTPSTEVRLLTPTWWINSQGRANWCALSPFSPIKCDVTCNAPCPNTGDMIHDPTKCLCTSSSVIVYYDLNWLDKVIQTMMKNGSSSQESLSQNEPRSLHHKKFRPLSNTKISSLALLYLPFIHYAMRILYFLTTLCAFSL